MGEWGGVREKEKRKKEKRGREKEAKERRKGGKKEKHLGTALIYIILYFYKGSCK
jgi:hypothetical protein